MLITKYAIHLRNINGKNYYEIYNDFSTAVTELMKLITSNDGRYIKANITNFYGEEVLCMREIF